MFNNKKNDETDFCESYKSEILGSKPSEKGSSLFSTIVKLLTIVILLVIIIGVSFYGYNYFMNSQKLENMALPPISMQVSDDELIVEDEESSIVIEKEENNSLPVTVTLQVEELDIEKVANDVKIAISKSEEEIKTKELNISKEEKSLEVPTSAPEAKYLEELADLSKEIDKERKK